jgi:hypothetical protein
MTNEEIHSLFNQRLFGDVNEDKTFPKIRPVLAHYTSIQALEQIIATEEIWFSNPLFMNDMEELRFGVLQGNRLFNESEAVKAACRTPARLNALTHYFNFYFNQFDAEQALDVYVFCLSKHDPANADGLLSMWRAYGAKGNGAAIVFDTEKLNVNTNSPLVFSRVEYMSTEERLAKLTERIDAFAKTLVELDPSNEQLHIAAWALFARIKMFALFTKHVGFAEEQEWRVVYFKERDTKNSLQSMFNYKFDERGIEPKLKFKVQPLKGITGDDLSLSKIVRNIILGPTVSHHLARITFLRMLDVLRKPEFKPMVVGSTIPFRPIRL